MKSIVIAAMLSCGAAGAASASDLSGSWVLKADFGSSARYTFVCTFKSDGGAVQGPCSAVQGRVLSATGSLDSKRMRLKYSTDYNGSGLDLNYNGEVRADGSVKGSVSNRLGDGVFGGAPLTTDHTLNPQAWRLNVAFDGVNYTLICSLKSDGTRLKGPCGISDGTVLTVSGNSDASTTTLNYDTDVNGQAVHAVYTGTSQPDGSLKGTIKAGDTAGTFTAKRP